MLLKRLFIIPVLSICSWWLLHCIAAYIAIV